MARPRADRLPPFNRFGALTLFSPAFGHNGVRDVLTASSPEPGLSRQVVLDLRVDIRGLLPKISVPTLVVGLTQDQMVPAAGSRQLREGIADRCYADLDATIWVLFERPDELVGLIRTFLFG